MVNLSSCWYNIRTILYSSWFRMPFSTNDAFISLLIAILFLYSKIVCTKIQSILWGGQTLFLCLEVTIYALWSCLLFALKLYVCYGHWESYFCWYWRSTVFTSLFRIDRFLNALQLLANLLQLTVLCNTYFSSHASIHCFSSSTFHGRPAVRSLLLVPGWFSWRRARVYRLL